MDVFYFYQIMAAVFCGNVLTGFFAYFWYASIQREKQGLDPFRLPFLVCLSGAIPPMIAIGAILLLE